LYPIISLKFPFLFLCHSSVPGQRMSGIMVAAELVIEQSKASDDIACALISAGVWADTTLYERLMK
jgi:hypothetical protein